jgi:hypothetical protein
VRKARLSGRQQLNQLRPVRANQFRNLKGDTPAIAPMSGPFVDELNYPWDSIRKMPIFMTEGTGATPSLVGSKAMLAWMKEHGFTIAYMEVNADHGGMIPLVLPSVFNFFDRCRSK